ncbi:16S rRNA (guanine(527)-N(7))-methyltransferase RsmG [Xylophilus sp. Kf1]|nr:16S rRNA (guanine(527)-N(7))-methyltransferase RsmG [Xylophilus sp. Kf1]
MTSMATTMPMTLEEGAERLGLALTEPQLALLRAYLTMLQKWNKVYNLTAVRDPAEMLTHHLLDSLSVIPPLLKQRGTQPFRLLDVGSGGGLPGAVIAICCPQAHVRCVDTVAKKAAFQQQVALELRLPNLCGVHARVETLTEPQDVVCSRAFASLVDFTAWTRDSVAEAGVWMAMKGKHPADELAALPAQVDVFHVEHVAVPGLDAERCIVWMKPADRRAA